MIDRNYNYHHEMIKIAKLMYDRSYIAACDGNLSVRLNDYEILTTPSGFPKGLLTVEDLVVTDMQGNLLRGKHKPSSEIKMHLIVYKKRANIRAIVHAHPPVITAFTLTNIKFSESFLPETILLLGNIKVAQYATPTTSEVPRAIEDLIVDHDAIILTRHGSLTVGKDLLDAYVKLESLEHSAKIVGEAIKLSKDPISPLSNREISKIWDLKQKQTLSEEDILEIISRVIKKL